MRKLAPLAALLLPAANEPPPKRLRKGQALLWLVAGMFAAGYLVAAVLLLRFPDYATAGPGDLAHASFDRASLPAAVVNAAETVNSRNRGKPLRGARVDGAAGGSLWIVYALDSRGAVSAATAIDATSLTRADDAGRIKPTGAWPHFGSVKSFGDWLAGLLIMQSVTLAIARWAPLHEVRLRKAERTGHSFLGNRLFVGIACLTFVGMAFIWLAPGWNRWQKWLWQYRWATAWASLFGLSGVDQIVSIGDTQGTIAVALVGAEIAAVWAVGKFLLAPAGLANLEMAEGAGRNGPLTAGGLSSGEAGAPPLAEPLPFQLTPPEACPTFAELGGMEALKQQLRDSIGLLLAYPDEAKNLGISFNGLLLHGPPGSGKTFAARSAAGEFGCNFIPVGSSELVSGYRGQSAKLIAQVFAFAAENPPAILFFDEFDGLALRREQSQASNEDRQALTQLLRSLEQTHGQAEVIVLAATNDLDHLDPAAIRPGRFDRHIRVDLPDAAARAAIFAAQLKGRPVADDVAYDELVRLTDGASAAAITAAVNRCALTVLAHIGSEGSTQAITHADLVAAIRSAGGSDRPLAADWKWEDLILPEATKRELQELQHLIEDPERAHRFGIATPAGAILHGPPGTGKTSVARVLAAQAHASFYTVKGSDVISKWMGESEQNVAQLFARARDNRPSIVFIDEIDAIAPRRSSGATNSAMDRVVNQLLQEIDGLGSGPGVFVLGATNRLEIVDEAVQRGGRLGRKIEIPLPDAEARALILRKITTPMPLGDDVDLSALAGETGGWSGADLEALCQQAAVQALVRSGDSATPRVNREDFEAALSSMGRERAVP